MTFRKSSYGQAAVAASILAIGLIVSACASDKSPKPTPTSEEGGSGGDESTGGKTSKGGKSGKGGRSSTDRGGAAGNDTGGNGASGGSSTSGGSDTSGGSSGTVGGSSSCKPDTKKDCYSCSPETNVQFLNACDSTGVKPSCSPYDNSKLTKLVNGKVPALP